MKRLKPTVILLVEDDPGDQELTRRALEESKFNNELHIVEDGEQALDYLHRRGRYADPADSPRPDLILLDLNMPRMDGKKVLDEIRADDALKHLVIVVLTTSADETDIMQSYDLGSNSVITKPADLKQFIQVIQGLEDYWIQLAYLPPDPKKPS